MKDGVLIDAEDKTEVRVFTTGNLKLKFCSNRHCLTEYGAVVAIAEEYG